MSLLFMDGFDHYDVILEKWDTAALPDPADGIEIDTAVGRFTLGSLKISSKFGGGTTLAKAFTTSDEIIVGFAWANSTGDIYDMDMDIIFGGGADTVGFKIDPNTGVGSLTGGAAGTVSSAGSTFTTVAWQYVEFRVKFHATLGEFEIKRDGVQVALGTGLDTLNGQTLGGASLRINASASLQFHHIDDLYILDTLGTVNNDFLGDNRITALHTTANGNDNDFTAFPTSANWQAVDEAIHDQNTTYVESGLVGAKDDYTNQTFAAKAVSTGTINGVQVVNASLKTDAGTMKYKDEMVIATVRYDNGTEVTSTSGAYKMSTFIRDTDPSDSAAWTESKVEAVGSGFTITFKDV